MLKILVVEDQAMVRGAISNLLSLEDNISIVGQVADGESALAFIENNPVDIVLSDIEMPNMSGIELAEHIHQQYPKIRVMIMTTFSKSGYIRRAIDAGVMAFILKESPIDYLVSAISQVEKNKRVIEPELAIMALEDNDPLSPKERKAIKLAGEGLKTCEIAKKLFLSEGTVRNYLSEGISKLNAANRIDAARIAKQKGWI